MSLNDNASLSAAYPVPQSPARLLLPVPAMSLLTTAFGAAPVATALVVAVGLFGCSVAAERAFVVARSRLSGNGRPFIERLVTLVQAGQIDEALAACSRTRAILPDIGLIVLRTRLRQDPDLRELADAAVKSTTPKLVRRLRYISASAIAVVLAGAGGTASAIAQRGGDAPLTDAMAPLGAALPIAAVLVLLHAFLVNQVDAILAQVAEFSHRLVNALLDRPDVRLGHR